MSVTKRGEKEQRLGEFISEHLAEARSVRPQPNLEILLIARSVESPVVRAVAGLAPEIAAAGYSLRMIVAQADREALPPGWVLSEAVEVDCEVRWARKPRLIEAHEQLVLGPQTCWLGDTMRRDPAKCDAYETFIDACTETAGSASVSFERLWQASEPRFTRTASARYAGESPGAVRRH
jgi:hypothetical protein